MTQIKWLKPVCGRYPGQVEEIDYSGNRWIDVHIERGNVELVAEKAERAPKKDRMVSKAKVDK